MRTEEPSSVVSRTDAYAAQLRALGANPEALDDVTDATTSDVVEWLEGHAPCPVAL
jgi:isocitrate lyase